MQFEHRVRQALSLEAQQHPWLVQLLLRPKSQSNIHSSMRTKQAGTLTSEFTPQSRSHMEQTDFTPLGWPHWRSNRFGGPCLPCEFGKRRIDMQLGKEEWSSQVGVLSNQVLLSSDCRYVAGPVCLSRRHAASPSEAESRPDGRPDQLLTEHQASQRAVS